MQLAGSLACVSSPHMSVLQDIKNHSGLDISIFLTRKFYAKAGKNSKPAPVGIFWIVNLI